MDFFTLTTNIFLGATAGYVTNNFAIKMLFKKYGPLGGVILKTKNEFIQNTSQLIEREIINHHTLEEKLESEELKIVIKEIVSEILAKKLPKSLEEREFKNIPEMEKTLSNIIKFSINNENFSNIDEKYKISNSIFKKKQIENIVTNFYNKLLKALKDNDINLLDEFSNLLYEEIYDEKLNDLIDQNLIAGFESNINNEIKNIDIFLKDNFDEEIEDFLNKIYKKLDIDKIVKEIFNDFLSKNDLINEESLADLLSIVFDNIKSILKKEKGQKFYNELIQNLIKDLDNSSLKFTDVIGIEEKDTASDFIEEEQDYFIDLIQYWLQYNKSDIEDLLDETLFEVLEEGSGLKNSLQKFIYSFLGEEGIAKYEPVAKMKDFLEEKNDNVDGFYELKILADKYGPKDLIEFLLENDMLAVDNLVYLLKNNKKEIIDYLIENISFKNINNYLKKTFNNFVDNNLQELIIYSFKDEYIYSPQLSNKAEDLYSDYFSNITDKKIKEILNEERYNDYIFKVNNYIIEKMETNKKEIIEFLIKYTNDKINDEKKYLTNLNLEEFFLSNFNDFILSSEEKYWKKAVKKIENNDEFSNEVVESILILFEDNLSQIIDGKIEETVAGSLNNLDDKDLQKVVEDFVGKELKPITVFGGGLGALGGILLYLFENLDSFSSVLSSGPFLAVLIYALIGYLTNVIAIWMIFHPYQEKNIFSYSLPLTPGVVAQNKDRFAKSMGEFVDNQLLNADSVTKILNGKKDSLIDEVYEFLADDDYIRIQNLLSNNSKKIAKIISEHLYEFIDNNNKNISEKMSKKIAKSDFQKAVNILRKIDKDNLSEVSSKYLADLLNSEINELKSQEKSINDVLKKEEISLFEDEIYNLNQNFWDNILEKDSHFNLDIVNKVEIKNFLKIKINEKIKYSSLNKWTESIKMKELSKIFQNKKILVEFLKKFIKRYFDKNREKVKEKFLKLIKRKIKDNNNPLLGSLMFNLSGIDNLANKVVDHFVDNKLSDFLTEKEDSLEKVVEEFINHILKTEIENTGFYLKKDFINKIADDQKKLMIKDNISDLNNLFIDELFKKDKYYYYEKINFLKNENSGYKNIINNLIDKLKSELKESLHKNNKEIRNSSFKLVNKLFQAKISGIKFNNLLADISNEDLYNSFEKTFNLIDKDKLYNLLFEKIDLIFADEKLKSFINEDRLTKSLEEIINKNKENIKNNFQVKAPDYLNNLIELSERETLDYFSLLFLETAFDSLEDNFIKLINAFELKEITKKEVEQMTSKEIEELFYSFAGKYMNRLKIYGLSGGGFGFISEIALKVLLS